MPEGQVVGLIGPSGAGKSTLIRCVNRLVEPSSGRVLLNDVDLTTLGKPALRRARRRIGMIFQEYALVERLTVMENVLSGRLGYVPFWRSWARRFPGEDIANAFRLLERVGLGGRADSRADALSGGQRQRVGIARALAQEPELLLVDEPTASLDPKTSRQIMRLITEVCAERGLPAIINIHDVVLAQQFAERIIGLRAGEVVFDGPPEALDTDALTADLRRGGLDRHAPVRRRGRRGRARAGRPDGGPRMSAGGYPTTWRRPPQILKHPVWRPVVQIGIVVYLVLAIATLEVDWQRVWDGLDRGWRFVEGFLTPDFTSRWRDISAGLVESLTMTVTSTVVGIALSVPVGIGAARNIAPLPVYYLCRGVIAVSRSLQEVIIAIFFVAMFGFGPFAGFVTLAFATIGFLAKLLAEDIEEIDMRQVEAIRASGASWGQVVNYAVQPQVMPRLIGLSLYRLDINFRESAVIGIVGAGGIGGDAQHRDRPL